VSAFLQQAEGILDVAGAGAPGSREIAIVLSPQGSIRMLDSAGWSLPALSAEFGATAVFRVERRGHTLRVEGFSGLERCLLQRDIRTPHTAKPFRSGAGFYPRLVLQAAGPAAISALT
jgi:hypothetical protein